MILLGVEAASTSVRATGFDERGAIVVAAARTLTPSTPQPGWVELDQDAVFTAIRQVIQELKPKLPETPELLCLTAPTGGLWLVDSEGKPVRPAILSTDRRAVEIARDWSLRGIDHAVYRRGGYALLPSTQAALLRWFTQYEFESLEQAQTAFYYKDALLHRLTGARVSDITDSSAPFLDLRSRSYDEELVDLLRLRQARSLLPPLDVPTGSLWPLSDSGVELTGLPAGLAVHAGPFDAIATGLGAGLQGTGDAFILLGPQLTTGIQIDRLMLSGDPTGQTVCLPRYDRWVRLLTAATGMTLLDWLLPLIGITYPDLDITLQRTPPGSNGISIVPSFSLDGETAPAVDPEARGRIIGLTTATTKDDLARAACESLAFSARHALETADVAPGVITLTGGGSRAPAFRQLLADILGHPIQISRQPETASRGAVIAGLLAADIPYDHAAWTAPNIVVLPQPETTAFYLERYAIYRAEIRQARSIS